MNDRFQEQKQPLAPGRKIWERQWRRATLCLISAAALLSLLAGPATARSAPDSFADLAQKLLPAVVNISTTSATKAQEGAPQLPQFPPGSPFEDFFREYFEKNRPQEQRQATSLGSGFIIDRAGIIVTNNHVIQDADEITVILHDNTSLKAKLLGRDPKTDLAVLRVTPEKELSAVPFGNSNQLRVGDWVMAIGNPFGLGGTVTAGIVSARGRNINSGPYDDFIQTDASINRGNSGGPLFNMNGEVVGINTAIFSPTGGSIGIGFSIPASIAVSVIDQLRNFGRTRRGWLGVRIQQVTDEIAESLGLEKAEGALVAEVTKGSPAEDGKLEARDIILSFNNQSVAEMRNLPRIVAGTEIGKKVPVVIWRDGKRVTAMVSVGELQEQQTTAPNKIKGKGKNSTEEFEITSLGLKLATINAKTRARFKLKKSTKGVVVTAVSPDGAAAEQQLKPGDVILEVGQTEVSSPREVNERVEEARKSGRKSILLLMDRQNGIAFVAIKIGKS